MNDERLYRLLEQSGAVQAGHFLLSSGKHSDGYIEKFHLLRNPTLTSTVCRGFADRFREMRPDVVVGPTTGGILLAFEVARQLGIAAAYAERAVEGSLEREFRRDSRFTTAMRAVVVDDILTTGGSIRETVAALEALHVPILGIGVLVDRSGGAVDIGDYPLFSLLTLNVESWPAAACPLCREGVPLTKPGTTAAS